MLFSCWPRNERAPDSLRQNFRQHSGFLAHGWPGHFPSNPLGFLAVDHFAPRCPFEKFACNVARTVRRHAAAARPCGILNLTAQAGRTTVSRSQNLRNVGDCRKKWELVIHRRLHLGFLCFNSGLNEGRPHVILQVADNAVNFQVGDADSGASVIAQCSRGTLEDLGGLLFA